MAASFGYDSEILYKWPFQTKIDDKKLTTVQDGGRKDGSFCEILQDLDKLIKSWGLKKTFEDLFVEWNISFALSAQRSNALIRLQSLSLVWLDQPRRIRWSGVASETTTTATRDCESTPQLSAARKNRYFSRDWRRNARRMNTLWFPQPGSSTTPELPLPKWLEIRDSPSSWAENTPARLFEAEQWQSSGQGERRKWTYWESWWLTGQQPATATYKISSRDCARFF